MDLTPQAVLSWPSLRINKKDDQQIKLLLDFTNAVNIIVAFDLFVNCTKQPSSINEILKYLICEYFSRYDSGHKTPYSTMQVFSNDNLRSENMSEFMSDIYDEIQNVIAQFIPKFDCLKEEHCDSILDITTHPTNSSVMIITLTANGYRGFTGTDSL